MTGKKTYFSTYLMREIFNYYEQTENFPSFLDLTEEIQPFINDFYFFSYMRITPEKGLLLDIFNKFFRSAKYNLCSQKKIINCPVNRISRIGGGFRTYSKLIYRYYDDCFQNLVIKAGFDLFGDLNELINPRLLSKFSKFPKKIQPAVIDLLLMMIRSPSENIRESWDLVLPPWAYKYYIKAEKILMHHIEKEIGDTALDINYLSPSRYVFNHPEILPIEDVDPFSSDIYNKLNIPNPEQANRYAFSYKPDFYREIHSFKATSVKTWEEYAYIYPCSQILQRIRSEKNKLLTEHRSAKKIFTLNNKPPVIFVLTPSIYKIFVQYYYLCKHRIPPLLRILGHNGYIRFAVSRELVTPNFADSFLSEFPKLFDFIYLPVSPTSQKISRKDKDKYVLEKTIGDIRSRYIELISSYNSSLKEQQLKFGHIAGIIGNFYEAKRYEFLFTLKEAIQYVFHIFALDYRSIMSQESSIYAFNKPPEAITDNAVLYISPDEVEPLFPFVNTLSKVNKAIGAKYRHIWFLDCYNQAVNSGYSPYDFQDIQKHPGFLPKDPIYPQNLIKQKKSLKNLKKTISVSTIKDLYGTVRNYFLSEPTHAKQIREYENYLKRAIYDELKKPLKERVKKILITSIIEKFYQLKPFLNEIISFADNHISTLKSGNFTTESTPYAISCVLIQSLLDKTRSNRIKKYFKRLSKHEILTSKYFDVDYDRFSFLGPIIIEKINPKIYGTKDQVIQQTYININGEILHAIIEEQISDSYLPYTFARKQLIDVDNEIDIKITLRLNEENVSIKYPNKFIISPMDKIILGTRLINKIRNEFHGKIIDYDPYAISKELILESLDKIRPNIFNKFGISEIELLYFSPTKKSSIIYVKPTLHDPCLAKIAKMLQKNLPEMDINLIPNKISSNSKIPVDFFSSDSFLESFETSKLSNSLSNNKGNEEITKLENKNTTKLIKIETKDKNIEITSSFSVSSYNNNSIINQNTNQILKILLNVEKEDAKAKGYTIQYLSMFLQLSKEKISEELQKLANLSIIKKINEPLNISKPIVLNYKSPITKSLINISLEDRERLLDYLGNASMCRIIESVVLKGIKPTDIKDKSLLNKLEEDEIISKKGGFMSGTSTYSKGNSKLARVLKLIIKKYRRIK